MTARTAGINQTHDFLVLQLRPALRRGLLGLRRFASLLASRRDALGGALPAHPVDQPEKFDIAEGLLKNTKAPPQAVGVLLRRLWNDEHSATLSSRMVGESDPVGVRQLRVDEDNLVTALLESIQHLA